MNTKKKREKRKCCPFICCAAVEDDVEVTQESRLPTFKKLAGKASMAQLGNRLDLNNTHEETMVDPDLDSDTEVTVVFQSPIESISGMDKQIVQMQSAVKCSFMESSSDGAAVRMCLRELFDITKGTYFSYIQDELIRSMRSMVPQEMWAAVNVHTTFSLISSIYEDVLKKYLSECSDVSSEDSFVEELYSRPRFPRIRLPKLRFKKQNNRMEATTVLAEDQTQNQPLPTEKPSNAPTSSAAVPKRKTFFSRVSAAFCRVFRKGAKTSA
ncbi:hypothetical protein MHYP_G00233010 [Metynnis hypsauchen]